MFVGTGSDVGKSVINTAFCRLFKQDGYSPAPFKAQNMSLNSYATPDGLEIGRAQAVQAEACGIPCSVEMNPVLLKPTSEKISQVVLNGKPSGNQSAQEYFNGTDRDALFAEAMKSYHILAQKHTLMVIEGAGSISEMNLWDRDITNMRVAEAVNAATILVADIDRGGVFASVYGTIQLLLPRHRRLIKGIIINKFRGDERLFDDGRRIIEEITGVPVIGVIPYFRDIFVEQEDAVVLDHIHNQPVPGKINIGVVLLKHMANFTDFDTLQHIPEVNLFYAKQPRDVEQSDILIIPGSKNTIGDMRYLQQCKMAQAIVQHHQQNKPLYGICGGYQMMGREISDPHSLEGTTPHIMGLNILPVSTVLGAHKKTEQCHFSFETNPAIKGAGYEIHMGTTSSDQPLCRLNNGEPDGCFLNSRTWGSYIHGIFDNASVIESVLQLIDPSITVSVSYRDLKEKGYNQLADLIRKNVDMPYIYEILNQA
jgi:adenosylcobyric acid synthase